MTNPNFLPVLTAWLAATVAVAAASSAPSTRPAYPAVGSIEVLDPQLKQIVSPSATLEKLADGFQWAEGPVWVRAGGYLLFSDVPANTVYQWKEGLGTTIYLKQADFAKAIPGLKKAGPNGLVLGPGGSLVLCLEGDRQIVRRSQDGSMSTLAEYYTLRRLNSPNDAVYAANGDLYFTDPPYGLEKKNDDPQKELFHNGVYRLTPAGTLQLLTADLTMPNGLAFSPDKKTLYVAVSDAARPVIMAYEVKPDGSLVNGRIFFNAADLAAARPGLPDGLKVDRKGNVFATGPGGVLVLSPKGKHLGTLLTGQPTANCAWGDDGSVLYIASKMNLLRVKTLTRGAGF